MKSYFTVGKKRHDPRRHDPRTRNTIILDRAKKAAFKEGQDEAYKRGLVDGHKKGYEDGYEDCVQVQKAIQEVIK